MDFLTTYEYAVTPGGTRTVVRRVLLLCIYGAVAAALLALGFFSGFLIPLLILTPLLVWALFWMTWRFSRVEYEYSFTAGTAVFSVIYGGKNRKTIATLSLRDAAYIKPAKDAANDLARWEPDVKHDLSTRGEPSDEATTTTTYLLLWEEGRSRSDANLPGTAVSESDEGTCAHKVHVGRRHALFFEATDDALKICRFYNPATVLPK